MEDYLNLMESADPDSNHFNDTIVNFKSYTPETFCGNIDNKGPLNILHHNVRSILKEGKTDNVGSIYFNDYEHVYNIRPIDNFFDMKNSGGGFHFL